MGIGNAVLFIIECVGVASFAISGTVIAVRKRLDLIGALVFALLTSFGGGLIRDFTLGVLPPTLFWSKEYLVLLIICITVSAFCFHASFIPRVADFLCRHNHDFAIEFTDTLGLAAFCVMGVESAVSRAGTGNALLLIFCGSITGVGGGMLRDVFSAQIPSIFRKHVYLLPAVCGSVLFVTTFDCMLHTLSLLLSFVFIVLFRLLAMKFKWNFPTPLGKEEEK